MQTHRGYLTRRTTWEGEKNRFVGEQGMGGHGNRKDQMEGGMERENIGRYG